MHASGWTPSYRMVAQLEVFWRDASGQTCPRALLAARLCLGGTMLCAAERLGTEMNPPVETESATNGSADQQWNKPLPQTRSISLPTG